MNSHLARQGLISNYFQSCNYSFSEGKWFAQHFVIPIYYQCTAKYAGFLGLSLNLLIRLEFGNKIDHHKYQTVLYFVLRGIIAGLSTQIFRLVEGVPYSLQYLITLHLWLAVKYCKVHTSTKTAGIFCRYAHHPI